MECEFDVFVSYSRRDSDLVINIIDKLVAFYKSATKKTKVQPFFTKVQPEQQLKSQILAWKDEND